MSHLSLHPHIRLQASPCFPHIVSGSSDVCAWMRTTLVPGVADGRHAPARLQRHSAPLTGRHKARFATIQKGHRFSTTPPFYPGRAITYPLSSVGSQHLCADDTLTRSPPTTQAFADSASWRLLLEQVRCRGGHPCSPASMHPATANGARGGAYGDEVRRSGNFCAAFQLIVVSPISLERALAPDFLV